MRRLVALVLACSWLAACTAEVRPPSVELSPAPVKVVIGGGGSGFCPPGQAKKGRC
jgi:hypothetical protein